MSARGFLRRRAGSGALPGRQRRQHLFGGATGVATLFAGLVVCGVASAYWTTTGAGTATASTASLSAPSGVTASAVATSVTVGFNGVTSPAGPVDGYVVTRWASGVPNHACGTDPSSPGTWLSAGSTDCVDSTVPSGTYTYTVTARFRSWSAQSAPSAAVAVVGDVIAPTQHVTVSGDGHIVFNVLYYRSGVAGSLRLHTAVTDAGSGPASARFPTTGGGVDHDDELVTSGAGSPPTTVYSSSPYTWGPSPVNPGAHAFTGRDVAGNAGTLTFHWTPDGSAPSGGALAVNGTNGTAGGTQSDSTTGNFTLSATHFNADAGSGLASSRLTVEQTGWSGGACDTGSWTAPVTVTTGPKSVVNGCYRYRLTGTDNVGNVSTLTTVVRVDTTPPTVTVTALPNGGATAYFDNASDTLYFANSPSGSLRLAVTLTDPESGPVSVNFPAANGGGFLCPWLGTCFSHDNETVTGGTGSLPSLVYTSSNYSWSNNAAWPGGAARTLTVTDAFGNAAPFSFGVSTSIDTTAPTGGVLRVNNTNANGSGSSSDTSGTSWVINTRTDWTDAGSGIASSTLVRESATFNGTTCGSFGGAVTLTGAPAQNGMSPNSCFRYTLTGTDNVGNVASISTTVRTYTPPPGPTVTSVQLVDGAGNPGQMDNDDRIIITFSEQMSVSSFCSSWSNNNTDKDLHGNGQVQVTLHNGNAANDYIELTSTGCGAGGFNFGRITLDSTVPIQNNPFTTFGGNGNNRSRIQWDASENRMTITLGEGSVGPGTPSNEISGNTVATYAPAPGIRSAVGNLAVVGVGVTANTRHF